MPTPINSPDRQTIGHRPCFESGNCVIPPLSVWPLANGLVRVDIMLPIEGASYVSRYFERDVPPETLPTLLADYFADPEGMLEALFANERTPPQLRKREPRSRPVGTVTPSVADAFAAMSAL